MGSNTQRVGGLKWGKFGPQQIWVSGIPEFQCPEATYEEGDPSTIISPFRDPGRRDDGE